MSIASEEVAPAFGAVAGRAIAGPAMVGEMVHTLEKDYTALSRLALTAGVAASELLGMSEDEAEAAATLTVLVLWTLKEVAERREIPLTES